MREFWYWSPASQSWTRVDEYVLRGPGLFTKRQQFRRRGFCTCAEKIGRR